MSKNIFFIPELFLNNINGDKLAFINSFNRFIKLANNPSDEDSSDLIEKCLKETQLDTLSKRDIISISATNIMLLEKLIKSTKPGSWFNDQLMVSLSTFKKLFIFLDAEDPNVYFNEILSFYKDNIQNPNFDQAMLDSYEAIGDKDFVSFIIKSGFTNLYNINEYGVYLSSSLIKCDPINSKEYVNVLITCL